MLATSPIYMVTDTATAARLASWPAAAGWRLSKLVAAPKGVRLAVRDPNGSGDGMVAAGSLGEAVVDQGRDGRVVAALSAALRQTRTVPGLGAGRAGPAGRDRSDPGVRAAGAKRTAEDAAVLPGTDHTAVLRYGWLPTAAAVGDPARKAAAGPVAGRAERAGTRPGR